MFLLAQFAGHERAMQYCDTHGIQYTRVMSGRDNSKGGVFVIPEIESAIIDLRIEYGVIRRNANVVQMNSDTKWVPRRVSGLTAYPVGPGQSGTYSDMTYDQVELVARKWMVLTKIEDELEEDSVISFADKFADEAAYAFTYAEDRVGFLGTGAGTDHGIIGIIPKITAATASIVTAAGNTFAEITEANLLSMIGLLPQFARRAGRNKWYGSNVVWANVLARLAFAKGGVTYTEMSGQMVPTFMGYPFENVEVMPVTDVNSQISLLFGNMSQAVTFGDRRGVTIKMADENDKDFEKDLTTMKATERFDLNAHDVGSTTAAGPLVALQMAGS
jgi:HK97 family phage major capsid protein